MLVNANQILNDALKKGYAIGAYNINGLQWARFILEACNEDRTPVILAVTEKTIDYFGSYKIVSNCIKSLINELNIKIPVVLHLDHGKSFESCKKAIDAGFTSVMIDASNNSIEENIEITSKVVNYAKDKNVSVEAEIGCMDGFDECSYDDAIRLSYETMIDFLAPSIGNLHGVYKTEPKLNFELLGNICKEVKKPLVLHGSSFLDDNKIKTAIFCGVSKININTELMMTWSNEVREYLKYNKEEYDPRKIIGSGEKSIKKIIHEKNELFGCKNIL